MKKIVLIIFCLVSFSYAAPIAVPLSGSSNNIGGKCYMGASANGEPYNTNSGQQTGSYVIVEESNPTAGGWTYVGFYQRQNYNVTEVSCSNPNECIEGQSKDARGVCVPALICPHGQQELNGICEPLVDPCPSGAQMNDDWSACTGKIKYGEPLKNPSGSFFVPFEDGSLMYCRADGLCSTTAQNGDIIDNHWYEGSVPQAPNIYKDLLNEALTSAGNLVGKTLQLAGYTIGLTASGGGILLSDDNPVTGAINPGVLAGAGLVSLGNLFISDKDKVISTPTSNHDNAVKVYFNDPITNNTAISDSAPSDGSIASVPNSDTQSQKLNEETLKQYQNSWAGQGSLGATVLTPTNQPSLSILETADQIKSIEKLSDSSFKVTEVNKSDIANTVKNGTDLPYTEKQLDIKINNDGTKSTTTTPTAGTVAPNTNANTKTTADGKTATSSPASNAPSNAGTSDGKSIDLSGVTARLDSLGNQLTKLNGTAGSIEGNTASAKGSLTSIQNQTASIVNLLNNGDAPVTAHTIPSDASGASWNSYSTTWENIKNSLNDVTTKVTEVKALFQNGFKVNLIGGAVSTCAYSSTVDFGYFTIPFEFDPCITASKYRNIFYTFFYLLFSIGILSFSVKVFLRLV